MSRVTETGMMEPEDAAAVIRTAFGDRQWQKRARNAFNAPEIVAALWVARRECGSDSMRSILRWAARMRGNRQ